ncbi:MAG: LamG domain-containing protein [Gammaproteobacteria bacterium]|nr:LamG domain-containing protein [Gammaproteobacteria bacterium]
MNKPSRLNTDHQRHPLLTGMPSRLHSCLPAWLSTLLPIALLSLTLAACDSVPTESTVNTGSGGGSTLSYTGPACGTGATDPDTIADACSFKVEFWDKMPSVSQCANCHNSETGNVSPLFMDSADVNKAYGQMINAGLVNEADIASSTILSKISNGHNCGNTTACEALATTVEGYINNWLSGGTTGGGSGTSNEIVLEVPTIKDAGSSKTLPAAPGSFSSTVWPLLTANCANCHRESAPIPQAPFFAEGDVDAAYAAILSSQKINLDIPANSRLVVRLREEFHNCWDPLATGDTNCTDSADAMEAAITAFAGTISLSAVDPDWQLSKAMNITDGQIASGGVRDDSSTIALYKFKDGPGERTIRDTSGVGTQLDLDLYGTEDVDYKWVGGWGIEFVTPAGKAQGTTQASAKLRDYITASGEYSIEAWVVPANVTQGDADDPARIISYSAGPDERNFTLGQAEYRYSFMNRSTSTDDNGEAALLTDDGDEDLQATQQHVVVTFSPATGRKVYVNGVDVSTVGADAGSTDPVMPAGSLSNWDNTFAFILGNEASNNRPWAGKLRLVAIHDRAMTPTQITQNFDAGVGEKFFVLFSVSEQMNASDCIVAGVHQCFVYFVVSQFDSYSYLFDRPTFISLNPAFVPSDTVIKGLRIGLNGKEPAVGQAYTNLDTTINTTDYTSTGQLLTRLGTIIALEKGADSDEFFLTFEDINGNQNTRTPSVCGINMTCVSNPQDGDPQPEIGLRTFEEILASMGAMTGVDPYLPAFSNVLETYVRQDPATGIISGIKQQLPSVEMAAGFLSAHQMAVAQLAIAYCDALVEDASLRANFFGSFDFTSDMATAFGSGDSAAKNQIVDALYDRMLGYPDAGNGNATLIDMPSRADIKLQLIGPGGNNLFDILASNCAAATTPACVTDAARTRAVTKALCTAVLGSAGMLIQ